MVTFTLSQSVREFAKSRVICAMHASVVYVPICQRANVPNACQLLIFTCQRANKCHANFSTWRDNVPNGVPNFYFCVPTYQKACQIFKHFSYEMLRKISRLCFYTIWHTFGTLARLFARWYVKIRSWHAFGTFALGHVDNAGTNDTCGTRFSKLSYALWKCKCDHEKYN